MSALARLLSPHLHADLTLTVERTRRSPQYPPPSRILLLLLAACALCAPIDAMAAEQFQFVINNGAGTVLPVGSGHDVRWEKIPDTNGAATSAILTLSWDGDDTLYSSTNELGQPYAISGPFSTAVAGVYSVFASADYSQVTPLPTPSLLQATGSVTFVAVTNVTASTNDIAVGTNTISLTAQMTPVNAGEFVTWFAVGGTLSAYQGQTVEFTPYTYGHATVTAFCGSSSAGTVINVYAVTAVTASPNPVAAGDNVTLTATVVPGGCPLPLTWNISPDTGLTVTTNFPAGYQTVTVTLGDSFASCAVLSVNVQEIKYEAVPNSGNWLAWPSPPYFPKGSTFRVRAIPNPYDPNKPDSEQWPGGKPVWGGEASGAGPIGTVTFGTRSTNATDLKLVTATCGNAQTNTAVVYEFNPLVTPEHNFTGRSTSQFGIGERLRLAVSNSPALLPPAVGTWGWSLSGEGDSREVGLLSDILAPFGTAKLTGPLLAGSTSLILWHEPRNLPGLQLSKSTNLAFISPTVTFLKGPGPGGRMGFPEVSGFIDIKVTPDNVSWRLLKVGEVDGQPSLGAGYFADINIIHEHGLNEFVVRTADGWFTAQSDKIAAIWLPAEAPDPATFAAGSWKWAQIPWFTYATQGQLVQADYITASDFDVGLLMANGQWEIFVKKLGIEFRRKVNDQTVVLDESRVFQAIPD